MKKKTYYKIKLRCSPYENYPENIYDISIMNTILAENDIEIIKTAKKDIYYVCTVIMEESSINPIMTKLNERINKGIILLSKRKLYFH